MNDSNTTNFENVLLHDKLCYVILEIIIGVFTVIGNSLVIYVFCVRKSLMKQTNYYILSLSVADLLFGLFGIPAAIFVSIGEPSQIYFCLFNLSFLVTFCLVSIFCLLGVSFDRYWAVSNPISYYNHVNDKVILAVVGLCWFVGITVGFLPLFGWRKSQNSSEVKCFFLLMIDQYYLIILLFVFMMIPTVLLTVLYVLIYRFTLERKRKFSRSSSTQNCYKSTRRDLTCARYMSILVLFFLLCWIPIFIIDVIFVFCENCSIHDYLVDGCILLSHLNSAGNPFFYAYHMTDFRAALCRHVLKKNNLDLERDRRRTDREVTLTGSSAYY